MKRKGFTLIELLAVIVVLAIIALIATPIILNVIEKAKVGSAENSVYGYVDAVEKSYVLAITDGTINNWPSKDSEGCYTIGAIKTFIKSKGTKPTDDTKICFDAKNTVSTMSGTINDYEFTYEDNKVTIGDKNEEIVSTEKYVGTEIESLINNSETYTYMGGTYLKGAQATNYAWYNGFMWRIMGVNSDGTVRLITDDSVATIPYGDSDALNWDAEGYIRDWLNDYFLSNLKSSLANIIQQGDYFCNELTTNADSIRTVCANENTIKDKIGLISVDEYNLAGGASSYLYICQRHWLMTPSSASGAWFANDSVSKPSDGSAKKILGVRPVINVSQESIITKGNGTATDMYILNENKTSITGTIGSNASSGEYVLLEGKTYRVVSKDSDGIKLILDGYYDENNDGSVSLSKDVAVFGNDNTFTIESGIGAYLNGDMLSWLGLNESNQLVATTWYQGDNMGIVFKYTDALKETNSISGVKVGLIRLGEMLSAQSSTRLTTNYAYPPSEYYITNYWTMNKYTSTTSVWFIHYGGEALALNATYDYGVRPVIKVKSDLDITGGNGTWNNPYQI